MIAKFLEGMLGETINARTLNMEEVREYNRRFGQVFSTHTASLSHIGNSEGDGYSIYLLDGKKGRWFHTDSLFCILYGEPEHCCNTISVHYIPSHLIDKGGKLRSAYMFFPADDFSDKERKRASDKARIFFKRLLCMKDEKDISDIFNGWKTAPGMGDIR